MSCPNLALVHTSIEHSRDWCRRLLILGCQEPYAHQALHPVRWCGRLLKTTLVEAADADIADALTLQDASKGKSVRMKSITFDGICQSIGNLTLF
ncbi:hypothetical protein CES94_27755 (plasmid) [Escherichia coli]|nr:hypothetical protein CES94_27755 [Escherichia coli]